MLERGMIANLEQMHANPSFMQHECEESGCPSLKGRLAEIRQRCHQCNGIIGLQKAGRGERFIPVSVRDASRLQEAEDYDELLSEEDDVAVEFEDDKGNHFVEYGMVEQVLVENTGRTGKKTLEPRQVINRSDPKGRVYVLFYEPQLNRKGQPVRTDRGEWVQKHLLANVEGGVWLPVSTENIVCTVYMRPDDRPGKQDLFYLAPEDEAFVESHMSNKNKKKKGQGQSLSKPLGSKSRVGAPKKAKKRVKQGGGQG